MILQFSLTGHRRWWHSYYPPSFLSFPDARLEDYYWIQIYKLGSAMRADGPILDLNRPWFNATLDPLPQPAPRPLSPDMERGNAGRVASIRHRLAVPSRVSYVDASVQPLTHESRPDCASRRKTCGEQCYAA